MLNFQFLWADKVLQRIHLILTGLNFYFILEKENVPNYYDTKKDF